MKLTCPYFSCCCLIRFPLQAFATRFKQQSLNPRILPAFRRICRLSVFGEINSMHSWLNEYFFLPFIFGRSPAGRAFASSPHHNRSAPVVPGFSRQSLTQHPENFLVNSGIIQITRNYITCSVALTRNEFPFFLQATWYP